MSRTGDLFGSGFSGNAGGGMSSSSTIVLSTASFLPLTGDFEGDERIIANEPEGFRRRWEGGYWYIVGNGSIIDETKTHTEILTTISSLGLIKLGTTLLIDTCSEVDYNDSLWRFDGSFWNSYGGGVLDFVESIGSPPPPIPGRISIWFDAVSGKLTFTDSSGVDHVITST